MLKTTFLNKQFKNPIILASGILGLTASSMCRAAANGCGGVTIKSLSIKPRAGHNNPSMFGTENYFINAAGLPNPGIGEGNEEIKKYKKTRDEPIIGSIFADSKKNFIKAAEKISEAPIDLLEVNISCPNVRKEFGEPYAFSAEAIALITQAVTQASKVPVIIKLSPQTWNIADLAKAAENAGADALCVGNTINGMAIDVRLKQPILHNKQGGVSGPALFPIALNAVYMVYKAVSIPIIGTGGVTTGEDALAMVMAGATLIGVGSAVYYRGEDVFKKITNEMEKIMLEENTLNLNEIRGCAHNISN